MPKNQKPSAKQKEHPEKLLAKVPGEKVFWCCDDSIFSDMTELAEGLTVMSDAVYAHHVNSEKNDFSKWLKDVVKDEKLAQDLRNVTDRNEAARIAVARVSVLTNLLP